METRAAYRSGLEMPEEFFVEGVSHSLVRARGLDFHVAEAGEGDPVVLLHGFPQHWWMWRHAIPPLAERYRVYAIDLRGFGWSDAPRVGRAGYDKREFAADILAVIDRLGIDRPVRLMGHDWGGWTGYVMSMTAPERIDRYMALNIPPPFADRTPASALNLLRLWYQLLFATPGFIGHVFTLAARRPDRGPTLGGPSRRAWRDGFAEFYRQFDDPARSRAGMLLYQRFLTAELPALLAGNYVTGRLQVPTRCLFGVKDFAMGKSQMRGKFEASMDDYDVEFVANSGHFIVDDQPQLVIDRALAWFAQELPPRTHN